MKKKKNKLRKALGFLVLMMVGAGVGYIAGKMGFSAATNISKVTCITLAILFIPTFFIVIGIHEGGHALAGVWVNFDFRMFVVGPFMWTKEQTGWQFKWNKNVNIAGGLVICLPSGTENLSKRFSTYSAGGPIASLLLAVLAYGLFFLISMADIASQVGLQIFAYFFLVMSFLSFIIFIITSIPMHISGFSSDGARVLRLLKGGETARFEILILKIISGSTSGLRPKLLDTNELMEAQNLANKLNAPFGVYIHSFFHQAAFDRGDIEKAENHLLDYINEADRIPEGLRNAVWLDAAFYYAFAKKDINEAEKYWNQFKPTAMISKAQVFATEAAISALKNEKDIVYPKIEAGLNEIPNMIDKGVGLALQEKLLHLRDSVEED